MCLFLCFSVHIHMFTQSYFSYMPYLCYCICRYPVMFYTVGHVSAADNRKLLHEQEVEKMLIFLLGHEDINVQVAAAHGIGVMALNMASCDSIGQWGM